ncbi:unnamed protein product [Arabidopsis lyrata]|uniref:Predicted protein n=1 Tax=Arabidopsis lyrata subsp. lyrata TaxID=81972 RepID=D7KSB3_ARALL|nr:predicted protein [Arabidopsis lyrata subsp. lyrata]CAH8257020.1 unnamed protein product [Arabidopsis lyrata]
MFCLAHDAFYKSLVHRFGFNSQWSSDQTWEWSIGSSLHFGRFFSSFIVFACDT